MKYLNEAYLQGFMLACREKVASLERPDEDLNPGLFEYATHDLPAEVQAFMYRRPDKRLALLMHAHGKVLAHKILPFQDAAADEVKTSSEKTAVVTALRKALRNAVRAAEDTSLVWHGTGGNHPEALEQILQHGVDSPGTHVNWFSTKPFNSKYFEGLGGVAVPQQRLEEIGMHRFRGGPSYRVTQQPVPLKARDLVVMPENASPAVETLVREKHLRRLNNDAGQLAEQVHAGNLSVPNAENAMFGFAKLRKTFGG